MRPAATLMQLALAVSSVAPVVSAWPNWLPDRDVLIVRAENDDSSSSATPAGTADSSSATQTSTKGGDKTTGGRNTATPTPTGKPTSGGNSKNSTKPMHTEFAPDAPPGGVSMIEPAITALGTALYRISDYVTFSWNYTSLLGTPTAVDVLASCSAAHATWTLTANMSFATSVNYVWDTSVQANDAKKPLLTEQYSLIIKDSDISFDDRAEPGYLGTNPAVTFGLYAGKPYQNLSEWKCPGCHSSAASPAIDGQALKFAATLSVATVLGFTWFI